MPDTLTIPEGATIDWGGLSSMISIMDRLKERDEADKAEAIRYQGQQDYSQMVAAGADPMDAMLKAAPKLFHRNPAGLAQVVEAKQRQEAAKQRLQWLAQPPEPIELGGRKWAKVPSPSGGYTLHPFQQLPKAVMPLGDRTLLMDEFRRTSSQLKELESMNPKIMLPEQVAQRGQLAKKMITLKNQLNALQSSVQPEGESDDEYPVGEEPLTPPPPLSATNRVRILKITPRK